MVHRLSKKEIDALVHNLEEDIVAQAIQQQVLQSGDVAQRLSTERQTAAELIRLLQQQVRVLAVKDVFGTHSCEGLNLFSPLELEVYPPPAMRQLLIRGLDTLPHFDLDRRTPNKAILRWSFLEKIQPELPAIFWVVLRQRFERAAANIHTIVAEALLPLDYNHMVITAQTVDLLNDKLAILDRQRKHSKQPSFCEILAHELGLAPYRPRA